MGCLCLHVLRSLVDMYRVRCELLGSKLRQVQYTCKQACSAPAAAAPVCLYETACPDINCCYSHKGCHRAWIFPALFEWSGFSFCQGLPRPRLLLLVKASALFWDRRLNAAGAVPLFGYSVFVCTRCDCLLFCQKIAGISALQVCCALKGMCA
jgi:hypothetical protein